MRAKVENSFHEIPAEARISLRDSILEHFTNLDSSQRQIVTQICITLADLMVQMPEWQNAIPSLMERFGASEKARIRLFITIWMVNFQGVHT